MDISRDVTYRGFKLHDSGLSIISGNGLFAGISGCVIDSASITDIDIVQFTEKRSLQDGLDAGDVYLGGRRIRLSGTIYARSKSLLFDKLQELKACLSPTLSFRESPGEKGYQPLYFSVPTNRTADYPTGAIGLQVLAMPRGVDYTIQRDQIGGADEDALAMPWQAVLVCKDPRITADAPQDYVFATTAALTTGGTAAITDLITKTSHGLVAGDSIAFTTLTGGTGLSKATRYYVISSGLTSSAFKVSTSLGGSAVDITVAYTDMAWRKVSVQGGAGVLTNRGDYHAPVNALWAVGAEQSKIVLDIADSQFTISIPASTGTRIVRYNGTDKIVTIQEEDLTESLRMDTLSFQNKTTHPMVPGGLSDMYVTFIGTEVQSGSHLWFWESYS